MLPEIFSLRNKKAYDTTYSKGLMLSLVDKLIQLCASIVCNRDEGPLCLQPGSVQSTEATACCEQCLDDMSDLDRQKQFINDRQLHHAVTLSA